MFRFQIYNEVRYIAIKTAFMRNIKVPAGIGDNIWLMMKLINSGEKFDFTLPDGIPQRGRQIFDIMPQVSASASYARMSYERDINPHNIVRKHKEWKDIIEDVFFLSCNLHLEEGHRIEEFLPDLKTSFTLPYETSAHIFDAEARLPNCETHPYIGIYGSSYSTSRAWGFWQDDKWAELIQKIHKRIPEATFVIIGADFDLDLNEQLLLRLDTLNIPYIKLIGENLGLVVEIMKRLLYFVAFPSGLPIMSTTLRVPTTMFYPKHLELMMGAWADPELIERKIYNGIQFCEPDQIIDWIFDRYKLTDKL